MKEGRILAARGPQEPDVIPSRALRLSTPSSSAEGCTFTDSRFGRSAPANDPPKMQGRIVPPRGAREPVRTGSSSEVRPSMLLPSEGFFKLAPGAHLHCSCKLSGTAPEPSSVSARFGEAGIRFTPKLTDVYLRPRLTT